MTDPTPKGRKPTIAELEDILSDSKPRMIQLHHDGSITSELDPTPEERPIFDSWAEDNDACCDTDEEAECFLRWMRAAVEARQEWCARVLEDPRSLVLSWSEIAAAIRKGPDAVE